MTWCIRGVALGLIIGPIITLLTDLVLFGTNLRIAHPWLLLTIPIVAVLEQLIRSRSGEKVENSAAQIINLINETFNPIEEKKESNTTFLDDRGLPPVILAPILLVNTFLTHICGASGGKEGAGVQIGSAVSAMAAKAESRVFHTRYDPRLREAYLICGAGGAFAALFSAPLSGCLFGMFFANPRVNRNDTFLPCLATSMSSALSSQALGIPKIAVVTPGLMQFSTAITLKVVLVGVIFGLIGRFFCFFTHELREYFRKISKTKTHSEFYASILLVVLTGIFYLINHDFDYNGLSTPLIETAGEGETPLMAPIYKLVLTAVTVAAGFTGGQIVPLLVIGATFGSTFANLLDMPAACMAMFGAMGLLSSGSKLPMVCFLLGLEMFGTANFVYLFAVTVIAFSVSGNRRIFESQIAPV